MAIRNRQPHKKTTRTPKSTGTGLPQQKLGSLKGGTPKLGSGIKPASISLKSTRNTQRAAAMTAASEADEVEDVAVPQRPGFDLDPRGGGGGQGFQGRPDGDSIHGAKGHATNAAGDLRRAPEENNDFDAGSQVHQRQGQDRVNSFEGTRPFAENGGEQDFTKSPPLPEIGNHPAPPAEKFVVEGRPQAASVTTTATEREAPAAHNTTPPENSTSKRSLAESKTLTEAEVSHEGGVRIERGETGRGGIMKNGAAEKDGAAANAAESLVGGDLSTIPAKGLNTPTTKTAPSEGLSENQGSSGANFRGGSKASGAATLTDGKPAALKSGSDAAVGKQQALADGPTAKVAADEAKGAFQVDAPGAGVKAQSNVAAPKAESKAAAPKGESKVAVPKGEAKAEAPKGEAKAAAPKGESKAATPKGEAKAEAPKGEAKAAAPKGESKAAAPKGESKAAAPKDEAKAEAPKGEAKAAAPKGEAKAAAPKGEAKAEVPKGEAKAEAPKDDVGIGSSNVTADAGLSQSVRQVSPEQNDVSVPVDATVKTATTTRVEQPFAKRGEEAGGLGFAAAAPSATTAKAETSSLRSVPPLAATTLPPVSDKDFAASTTGMKKSEVGREALAVAKSDPLETTVQKAVGAQEESDIQDSIQAETLSATVSGGRIPNQPPFSDVPSSARDVNAMDAAELSEADRETEAAKGLPLVKAGDERKPSMNAPREIQLALTDMAGVVGNVDPSIGVSDIADTMKAGTDTDGEGEGEEEAEEEEEEEG